MNALKGESTSPDRGLPSPTWPRRGIPITSGDPTTGNALYAKATTTDEIGIANPVNISNAKIFLTSPRKLPWTHLIGLLSGLREAILMQLDGPLFLILGRAPHAPDIAYLDSNS